MAGAWFHLDHLPDLLAGPEAGWDLCSPYCPYGSTNTPAASHQPPQQPSSLSENPSSLEAGRGPHLTILSPQTEHNASGYLIHAVLCAKWWLRYKYLYAPGKPHGSWPGCLLPSAVRRAFRDSMGGSCLAQLCCLPRPRPPRSPYAYSGPELPPRALPSETGRTGQERS